ncbi:unnamed protein product [Allacma fusca]|uniref:HTH psq-type domain-containing protein n=1 Tax=Allacma fusca TaxID=39272 RepID=A0A8J2JJQ3_9HEXA|nr:unnamed protein product [Allacma fusca]
MLFVLVSKAFNMITADHEKNLPTPTSMTLIPPVKTLSAGVVGNGGGASSVSDSESKGMTFQHVSEVYDVPKTTLRDYMVRKNLLLRGPPKKTPSANVDVDNVTSFLPVIASTKEIFIFLTIPKQYFRD